MPKKDPKPVYLRNGVEILNNYELFNWLRDNKHVVKFDLLVALCLATRRNSVLGCCFPSLKKIAEDAGISKPRVVKSIKSLESLGILVVINEGKYLAVDGSAKHNGMDSNYYYFIYDLNYLSGIVEECEDHPINKETIHLDRLQKAIEVNEGVNSIYP